MVEKQTCYVGRSRIPNAGMGLFAARDISMGEIITTYMGYLRPERAVLRDDEIKYCIGTRYKGKQKYLIGISSKKHLRKKGAGLAQIANDAIFPWVTGFYNNSFFDQIGSKIVLRALIDIPESAEIFVEYGENYWNGSKNIFKEEEKKQAEFTYILQRSLEEKLCAYIVVTKFTKIIIKTKDSKVVLDKTTCRYSVWMPECMDDVFLSVTGICCLPYKSTFKCPGCKFRHRGQYVSFRTIVRNRIVELFIQCPLSGYFTKTIS